MLTSRVTCTRTLPEEEETILPDPVGPAETANPYDVQLVPFAHADAADHYTISSAGVTHFTRMRDGTPSSFSMAIGIMSSASHKTQRMAVRASWLSDSNEVLGCFLVGFGCLFWTLPDANVQACRSRNASQAGGSYANLEAASR